VLIKHPKDFWAGAMFIAFGVAAIAIGSAYPLGTAARMGPGYFPRILGLLLIALGALLSLRAFKLVGNRVGAFAWKPLIIILGSVVLFGLTLDYLGLVVSTILLIIVSSMASHEFTWKSSIISGVLLAAFTVAAFAWGLKLQFQIWPKFFGG
jgi:hypothetical protein